MSTATGSIFDTIASLDSLDVAVAPERRRPIIDVMCDTSIPLFGTYLDGKCVEPGRAELRDAFFASLGYTRGTPRQQGQLAPWTRRGDRRFCDIAYSGRIYSHELVREPFVSDTEGLEELGWVAAVYDLGLNGAEQPKQVGTVRERRVNPATGEVTEQAFRNGRDCVTAAYQWLSAYCEREAEAWRTSEAAKAHQAAVDAHITAQREARLAPLKARAEALKATLGELRDSYRAALAEGDEDAVADFEDLGKVKKAEYDLAVADYRRANIDF